jgi:di/tricarboxylate transporter
MNVAAGSLLLLLLLMLLMLLLLMLLPALPEEEADSGMVLVIVILLSAAATQRVVGRSGGFGGDVGQLRCSRRTTDGMASRHRPPAARWPAPASARHAAAACLRRKSSNSCSIAR